MLTSLRRTIDEFPRAFWMLVITAFIDLTGGFLIFPFFSLFLTEKFKISLVQVAGIFAIWSIAGVIGQTVAGAVADRFGRRLMILVGLVFSAISSLGFVLIDDLTWALLVAGIAGFFSSSGGPARSAMVADVLPKEKYSDGYGILRVVANVAFAIGPAIGGLLAGVSYALLFSIDALTSILAAIFVVRYLPESIPESSSEENRSQSIGKMLRGYFIVLKDSRLLIVLVLGVVVSIFYGQWYFALPVFMRDTHNMPPYYYGWMMSLAGVIVVFFQLPITRRLKNLLSLKALAWGSMVFAVGFALYGVSSLYIMFLVAAALVTLGEMIFFPTQHSIVAQLAVEQYRARYMAVATFAYTLPNIIGPAIGGYILENAPPYGLWFTAAVLLLLCSAAYLWVSPRFEGIHVGGD